MRIEIDDRSGFCTGVKRAVRMAGEQLGAKGSIYSLGDLVHNEQEAGRLADMGLASISYEEFNRLDSSTVLIRAHGEPPSTYERAGSGNIELVDATCPIVRRLQERIREAYESLRESGGSLLIFGKQDHPEVRSLVGQTEGTALVMRDPGELREHRLESPVFLFSQTTMKTSEFENFAVALEDHMQRSGMDTEKGLSVNNTICGQVSRREPHLREFVSGFDLVLFVSGKKSSNGRALFEVCRRVNRRSFFISDASESDRIDIEGIESIGICGATSTPRWQMEAVRDRILNRLRIKFT